MVIPLRNAAILFLLFPVAMSARGQSLIKTSKPDKSKSYTIETKSVNLVNGVFNSIAISIRSTDTTIYIRYLTNGIKYTHSVSKDAPIVFTIQDHSTASIYSMEAQGTNVVVTGNGGSNRFAKQDYRASYQVLQKLKKDTVVRVSVYTIDGHYDCDMDEKGAKKLTEVASEFLAEFDKQVRK